MTTPTTPRPAPEAVEAAMRYADCDETEECMALRPFRLHNTNEQPHECCIRILAAEVEWLRYEASKMEAENANP